MTTKLAHRVRAFAPKTKSGCKTCRSRRVKCDEARPVCKKCATGDRKCEWYDGPSPTPPKSSPESSNSSETRILKPARARSAVYVPDPSAADLQPLSLGVGLDARERSALGFFINRTARDLGYSFPSMEWITRTLQLGHEEPTLRYAMVALGSMHQARKAYTHVSMFPVIDPGHLKEALAGYGKAMTHLRRRLDGRSVGNSVQTTSMILLSCLLFFCFEQLAGNQSVACVHMQKGKRIVKEMLSSEQQAQIEPFLRAVFALFSGFEDINFAEFQTQTTSAANHEGILDVAYSIPTFFNDFSEANNHLKRLEKARARLREELLSVADKALKTLETLPADPAVILCLKHCLSRSVDLSGREDILRDLEALHYGYDAWISASRNSGTDLGAAPHSWAVIRMQCLISRFNARTMREPSEMISDLYEDDFVEVLDLAETCLLVYPSTDEFFDSVSGVLSNSGYGLALSTEMLPQVALCGFKSRCTATRERAIDLLFVANKHDGVYQSAIFARFVRRPVEWEQRKALELGAIPGLDGFEPSQIPEEARIVDSVFAQVKYRPRCINMINCRYACNEAGDLRLEITEEICDLFTGAEFSSTTYDIATPQSCQQGIPQSSAGLVKSVSSPGSDIEPSDISSAKCAHGILHMHSVYDKEKTSTSTPVSISSSATSAPVNVHPAFSMIQDSEYSPWRSYPSTLTRSSYSRYPKVADQSTRTMRVPAGTLPE